VCPAYYDCGRWKFPLIVEKSEVADENSPSCHSEVSRSSSRVSACGDGGEPPSAMELFIRSEEKLVERKHTISVTCSQLMEDPEANVRRLTGCLGARRLNYVVTHLHRLASSSCCVDCVLSGSLLWPWRSGRRHCWRLWLSSKTLLQGSLHIGGKKWDGVSCLKINA